MKLILGEAASFFQISKNYAYYYGGFCGTKYNFTISKFEFNNHNEHKYENICAKLIER